MRLREMIPEDWPLVRKIYQDGLDTGNASFETLAPEWESWNTAKLKHSRLVAETNDLILGWAALSPVSERCVYGGVAEVSVYVSEDAHSKGIGHSLLKALITSSEENGMWTLQSGIFEENETSIKLHKKCGFRIVGLREKIGQREGIWRNVVLMERRSSLL